MNICELLDNNNQSANDEKESNDSSGSNNQENEDDDDDLELTPLHEVDSAEATPNDDNFDDLSELEQFIRLCETQKLDTAIKHLVPALESCTSSDEYLKLFSHFRNSCFSNDVIIRSTWIEQIPNVVQYYSSQNLLDENLQIEVALILSNLLQYTPYQVRKIASSVLVALIERNLIEISKIEQYVIPCLLNLVNENNDDIHVECVSIFGKLAPLLGSEITVKHFLIPFCRLCTSPVFHTRKVCATNIGEIAAVISSEEVEEFLLTHFIEFIKDQVWAIRKVCAEIFPQFANKCSATNRADLLTDCFIRLLEDQSRWVKISAYKTLGSFIATFLNDKSEEKAEEQNEKEKENEEQNEKENEEPIKEAVEIEEIKNEEEDKKEEIVKEISEVKTTNIDEIELQEILKLNDDATKKDEELKPFANFLYWRNEVPQLDLNSEENDYKSKQITSEDDIQIVAEVMHGTNEAKFEKQQNIIPEKLLNYYLTMVEMNAENSLDSEMNYNCAFNLPAIVFTLGKNNWDLIRELYLKLAEDVNWKVRQTLAYSIHEIANIIDTELAQEDLVPIFDSFIKDVDEVRIGIVSNLSKFLRILTPECRKGYLPKLMDFLKMDNQRNWRFRNEFAIQIALFCNLFSCECIAKFIQPIIFTLALDKVFEVRVAAVRSLAQILLQYVQNGQEQMRRNLIEDAIRTFAKNERWSFRQLYVFLCENIIETIAPTNDLSSIINDYLPPLLELRNDKVPNIRICLARVLSKLHQNDEYKALIIENDGREIQQTIENLLKDNDSDVKSFFNSSETTTTTSDTSNENKNTSDSINNQIQKDEIPESNDATN